MLTDFKSSLRPALVMAALFAALLGILYPLVLTGIGQAAFPHQANGSLVVENGEVTGSELIGQAFAADRYFHGRPSAAGKGYDASASSGSNLAPTAKALVDRVAAGIAAAPPSPGQNVPADLVTTSASGLDPDLSPEAAFYQAARVAKARHLTPVLLHVLIEKNTAHPLLGLLGENRVNILALNRALDQLPHRP